MLFVMSTEYQSTATLRPLIFAGWNTMPMVLVLPSSGNMSGDPFVNCVTEVETPVGGFKA